MLNGKEAEELFCRIVSTSAKEVIKASNEEDMFGHWDYKVDGVKYDVKMEKKLNRWDTETSDVFWIEAMNVRGDAGWLRGAAHKIAFLSGGKFIIVDREKLREFIANFVEDDVIVYEKEYKKWYRRRNRLDAVTYVFPEDIKHLVEQVYEE